MNQTKAATCSQLRSNKEQLAREITELEYKKKPEVWEKYGEEGKLKSIRDSAFHLDFLIESIEMDDKSIFMDYIEWTKVLFRQIPLPENTISTTLHSTQEVLSKHLTKREMEIVSEYIREAIQRSEKPAHHIHSYIQKEAPLGNLARSFNKSLLRGDKRTANKLIMEEVEKGTSIKDIYLHVFQISQKEVGRLWLLNQISVAKEHFASAATQMIMSQLYPYIFSTKRKGHTFIGASIGDELHELGVRMVGDFFEMDGWDTYYLGANTPAATLIEAIRDKNADILGLSVSMPIHQSLLRDSIQKIKKELEGYPLKVMVGGIGIKNKQNVHEAYHADGYAENAEKAVIYANQMISRNG